MLQFNCKSFLQGLIIISCFGIISLYIEKNSLDYIPAFSETVENIFINFQGNGKIILKQSQQIDQIFQAAIETFETKSNSKSVLIESNWKKVSKTDLILNMKQTFTSSKFTPFIPEICIGVLFLIIVGVILIKIVVHFHTSKYKQHKNKKDKYWFKKMKLFNRKLNIQKNSIEVADQLTSDREDDCPSSSKSSSKNTIIYLPPTPEKSEIKSSNEKVIEYILNHFPSSNRKIKKLSGLEIFSICLTSIILLFVITVFTDMSIFTVKDISTSDDDFPFIVLTLFIPQENELDKIKIFAQQKFKISDYSNSSATAFESKIDKYVKCHVENEIKIHKFILQIFDIPMVEKYEDLVPCNEKHKCFIAWQQGRSGCDPNSKACICQRGFRLFKGSCLDENECQIPLINSFCESHSKCLNTVGTHRCQCSRFSNSLEKHCPICQRCATGSYDSNQCIRPTETNCIDATEPVKKVSKRIDNIKDIITIKPAENVFGKNILDTLKLKSNLQFQEFNGRPSETILGASGLIINITLLNVNLPPIFEDIQHKSDNEFILNSSQGSNLYHLKRPLLQIMKNYCRHPLPDSYFITMTTYTDRHTKAQRYNCDQMKYPFNSRCQQGSTDYNSFYVRSINDQCSVNKAMFLSEELHSFYCVENNKLVNDIFKHHLKESISFHPDHGCDYARRNCNTCKKKMCSKAGKSTLKTPTDENCCLTKCLNNKNCQIQYSSECHYTDRLVNGLDQVICMQGDTAKFTLNPQFDFKNNKFKCHIRKQTPNNIMRVMIQFSIPGKGWSSNLIIKDVPYSDPGTYNIGNITFYWSSKLNSNAEMILHGYQNTNHGQQFFSLSKINQNPSTSLPKLQKHGDKSYIEVEFENIFEYSTSNWNSLSCKVNVSKIKPINRQTDYTIQNVMPVSIVHSDKRPFTYVLKSAIEEPEIEIEVKENTSLIKSLLCDGNQFHRGRIVKDIQNNSFTAQLSLQKWPYQWNLLVEGFVSNDATFVNIQITDVASGILLADYEQIVFNPVKSLSNSLKFDSRNINTSKVPIEFSTYFHIDLQKLISNSKSQIHIALLILVQDCFSTHRKRIFLHPRSPRLHSSVNKPASTKISLPFERQIEIRSNQIAFQKEMYQYLLQYLAIITFAFSIIYFFIIIALIIIRLCSKTDQKSLMQKIHSTYRKSLSQDSSQHVQTISTKRRMVLFLFVAFKVFYNFVFTLSVGLSLVLSLESNLTPFEITPSRFLFSVEQEVRKLDNYGSDELRRQNEFVNTMNKACQEKRKNCEISLKNHIKSKYDTFIDPWTVSNKRPIYKSIGRIFNIQLQREFEAFYNYSRQLINRQINDQFDRYQSYLNQFTNSVYIKTAIQFSKNATLKSNHSLKYYSILGSEMKSFSFQSIPDLYEPLAMFSLYVSFSNEYFKLHNITTAPDSIFKPSHVDFKETIQSKTKRYFHSTLKFNSNRKQVKFSPLDSEINKYYKTRMKIILKNNRFQLKISLWQMRLIIVFIDIIIITYRFYHTLTTIKIIWFGSHIYLSLNNCGKPSNREKLETDVNFQIFRFVKFKHYIRNNPTIEIAELGLSVNKLFPCFDCCKRLYYVCIIISLTILVGVASIFVLSFYCMGRSQTNLPSSVADMTLQYMTNRINWLTSRHATRINTEKLNVSIFADKGNRKRLTRLQRFFQHEETQIQNNLQYHVCEFLPANHFFRSLKTYCNNNYVNTVDCSQQSCYFISIKSLNYTENQFLKEIYSTGPLTTSLILIPLLRFIAVTMLVVSAILIMLGIIYHSSKLLARIFLKFSQPINATVLNRNFPLLSKSIMKQHFSHSTLRSMSERTNTTFNTPNRNLQTNPIFLKDISNNFSSPVITRSTNTTNHSESRV